MERSPLMGFNHNIRHLGWLFHVQTEDSGTGSPHIITHLFQRGVILATKKTVYDPAQPADDVRNVMQGQHKTVLRELKDGLHNDRIRQFLGEAPAIAISTATPAHAVPAVPAAQVSDLPAASWPQSLDLGAATGWEWREELLENNAEWASAWKERLAGGSARGGPRMLTLRMAPVRSRPPEVAHQATVHFPSREALLEAIFPNGRLGGVVVPLEAAPPVAEKVGLALSVDADAGMEFNLEGAVSFVGADGRTTGLAFPSSEHGAVRRMVLLVRGARAARTKAGPHPLSGTGYVVLELPNGPLECSADVTEHGLFLPEELDLAPGTAVPVQLRADDNAIAQRVDTVVEFCDPETGGGVGLRFQWATPEQRTAVVSWVDSLLRH